MILYDKRRCGNTTRQIDLEIQELFRDGHTIVWDHHAGDSAHKYHMDVLLKRLSFEHRLMLGQDLEYDGKNKTLKLINQ